MVNYGGGGGSSLQLAGGVLTGPVSNTSLNTWDLDNFTGTDDQKMVSALTQVVSAGGGTILLAARSHTFANQWSSAYVSSSSTTGIRIIGQGVAFNGAWGAPSAATVCAFTYAGAGAGCADFQHNGSIEVAGIQFTSANLGVPFIFVTNPTPNIHDNVFSGGGSGVSCVTDAIILGGATASVGAGDTAAYQGYQGAVYRNFFDGIRRTVLFQADANGIEVFGNTVSATCGNAGYLGGCIEVNNTVNTCSGLHIWGNVVEMVHYPCFARATNGLTLSNLGPNGLFDAVTTETMAYYVFLGANCQYNTVRDGFRNDSIPLMVDLSGTAANEATTFHQSQLSLYTQPIVHYNNSQPEIYTGPGGPPVGMDQFGNGAQLQPLNDVPSANDSKVQIVAYSCTQVTDGIIYSASPWVVSSTAVFTSTDVYRPISFTGGPSVKSVIIATVTHTTAWPWTATTAHALGDIARPTAANGHLYQCTMAGTTGSSQPAWPTSGGTVTDGTAVWTDLGTSATAALMSGPATATNTGVTVNFGRMQAAQSFTTFRRHHIDTSDGGTPSTGADAGAGTGPTGISTTGSDHSFTVNITTGTSPAAGQMFHTNMAQNAGTLRWMMVAGNAAAATLMEGTLVAAGGFWLVNSANSMQVNFIGVPAASTAYIFIFIGMA